MLQPASDAAAAISLYHHGRLHLIGIALAAQNKSGNRRSSDPCVPELHLAAFEDIHTNYNK